MDCDPGEKEAMSLRLSKVLGDIGVNREMVILRRKTWLTIEKLKTFFESTLRNTNIGYVHTGSQSEGTTTLEMESDVDILYTDLTTHVILNLSEWQTGRNLSLLVLKNEHSPPQHCNLQLLMPDRPLPVTLDIIQGDFKKSIEVDMEGRFLLKNTRFEIPIEIDVGNAYIKKGPSRSISKDIDYVHSISCISRPDECMFLFLRPRPGHWPSPAILAKARQAPTYLIPQGHDESCYRVVEWRLSTPSIERLLMFDLTMIKLKVYTFLKILRKTYFKPEFDDRFSTYHFKTAMLFTLESYPPDIWKRNNLLQCMIYCLVTLKRWCRMHYCPHYTISGVDLFFGKLKKFELPRISSMLSDMIVNMNNYVVHIKMDLLGERMLMLTGTQLPMVSPLSRFENTLSILQFCLEKPVKSIYHLSILIGLKEETASQLIIKYRKLVRAYKLFIKNTNNEFAKDVFFMFIKFLNTMLASVQASVCIESRQDISEEINTQYEASNDLDLTSGRLKFASMLYCTGQYEKAETVLKHTEELLHPDVWQFSLTQRTDAFRPSRICLNKALYQPVSEIFKTSVALSITFLRHELHCVPNHLVYEMYRTFTLADVKQRKFVHVYMDSAAIESVPFLYYLQYLTYRRLGQHNKKRASVKNLADYLDDERNRHGYIDTATKILGHCFELENRLDLAWHCYCRSLWAFPYNNLQDGTWRL